MSLNSQSPLPLYQQLASRLRQSIANGELGEREKIPSETILAERYGIGRPTVRQATDLLVREGVLQRRRGSGTYVLPQSRRIDLFSLAGTSAALRQSQVDSRIELLDPPELLETGSLPPVFRGEAAYRMCRLSRIDGRPVLLEHIYLSAELFKGIEHQKVAGDSLSRIVREVFHLEATSADQEFDIKTAGVELAGLLDVDRRTALLHVTRSLHFGIHRSAIYCDIFCRTDEFRFSQTITTPDLLGKELDHAK